MKRRHLLAAGAAGAALLAIGGTAVAWWRPARQDARLLAETRLMLARIAEAVLDLALPVEAAPRAAALHAHVDRVEQTIAGMPPAMQAELDQLLSLLLAPPGRQLLLGLAPSWADASVGELQQALQGLRRSRLSLRQQVFHALRDLSNAAYFAEPGTWALLGYPGPVAV